MSIGSEAESGRRDVFNSDCPAREVLDHITSRWAVLVLVALKDGPLRFYELRDRVDGISEKMLSQNLRVLSRDGLLERTVEPTVPPKVSYTLSSIGREGVQHLCELTKWIARTAPEIKAAQERHDRASE
ncbi:DNA-binding HxlR family transcriptional regulator [Lipingzhangella halophila]|uniref:DNA-binding HxlR family transcriptional regulator n=1 Tax=Lipingzhangella halophila TaxID=1783352 RepID=A0A7W7RFN2_9ACTN|nr:helix-turn-helix domain-containing protein [Lipingzhangella halophila]MBB4931010.1 DNA-binding HxlR family transcriptional regulator [Lipingzhangella halophila]